MTTGFATSFAQLFTSNIDETHRIASVEIPRIQRDYAQGRTGTKAEQVRKDFLQALYTACFDSKTMSLDFVYGSITENVLSPLDGQQRLTTLFLLHIYLADHVGVLHESHPWKNFTYETRASARRFCERIGEHFAFSEESTTKQKPSEWIKNQEWYQYHWQHDATIQSMLVMLDDIHCLFGKKENPKLAWDRLMDEHEPAIYFHMLPIENLGLTDQVYIKMNSRGKPLTAFETFKARFGRVLESVSPEHANDFADKVDTKWSDLLWHYKGKDNLIDHAFMRYFHFVTDVCVWRDVDQSSGDEDTQPLEIYELAKSVYGAENRKAINNIVFLINAFDTWEGENDIKTWFDDRFCFKSPALERADTQKAMITEIQNHLNPNLFQAACALYGNSAGNNRNFPLGHTLYLYAVLLHRIQGGTDFQRRMRILRNLVEGSRDYLRNSNMTDLIADVTKIMTNPNERILDGVKRFLKSQIDEEKEKIAFLDKHPELKTPLFQLEDHRLLRGSLAAFELDAECFERRAAAFHRIFESKENYKALTGALLAAGDYSRLRDDRFFQFGLPSKDYHYDKISWRYMLTVGARTNSDMQTMRSVLGQLLDAVILYDQPIKNSLEVFSNEWVESREKEQYYDWRTYFVKYTEMRDGESGIYAGSEGSLGYQVCMLNKRRVSSYYRDPYLSAMRARSATKTRELIDDPRFIGYEHLPRWLELKRSHAGIRCINEGYSLREPTEEYRAVFETVCNEHGAEEITENEKVRLLRIPQAEHDGKMIDTEDRIVLGAKLLDAFVEAGL